MITKQTEFVIECNDTLWKDIIENIAIRFIDEYQSWFQIVCGLFAVGRESDNVDHYKEVARSLSMKSKKYDNMDLARSIKQGNIRDASLSKRELLSRLYYDVRDRFNKYNRRKKN